MNDDSIPQEPKPGTLTRKGVASAPPPTTNQADENSTPPRRIHELKLESQYYERYAKKKLSSQVRNNDRRFTAGELCRVREFDPLLKIHTQSEFICIIDSVDSVPGLQPGYVLLHTHRIA
jgi:hypothetical protein